MSMKIKGNKYVILCDFESAKNWYYSKEHQEISVFRQAMTEGWETIIPGVDEVNTLVEAGYFDCKP